MCIGSQTNFHTLLFRGNCTYTIVEFSKSTGTVRQQYMHICGRGMRKVIYKKRKIEKGVVDLDL